MKITIMDNGKAAIKTPYNADFVKKIKQIGGAKWDGEAWIVPATEVDIVRGYMREVYGETDVPSGDRVTVDVTFVETAYADRASIFLFGREVCRAHGRDSGAKVCEGVTILSGTIGSGGSRVNWDTRIEKGTVVRIRDLPREVLNMDVKYKIEYKVLDDKPIDREALEKEKTQLLARIAEIDKLLNV